MTGAGRRQQTQRCKGRYRLRAYRRRKAERIGERELTMHATAINRISNPLRLAGPYPVRRREIGSADQFIVLSSGDYLFEIEWVSGPRKGQRQSVNAGFLTKCEEAR